MPRILGLGLLFSSLLAAEMKMPEPVAIVYLLTGEASQVAAGADRRPLRLYDRLPAGASIDVGAGSRLSLGFVNGRRYELGEGSRVRLGARDLAARSGPVRSLPKAPPLPPLAPIASDERPGPKAGAVRIRGQRIGCLTPREGTSTLAGATTLGFVAEDGAAHHQVEVEDGNGNVIFHQVTEGSIVTIPARTLAPGARYHWTVKALDGPGPGARGEADFVTLPRKSEIARQRLRKAVEAAGDSDSRALLDAVDHLLSLDQDAACPAATTGATGGDPFQM